jgi:hypothetical protein
MVFEFEEKPEGLPLDPNRGILMVARKLRSVIKSHVEDAAGRRTGSIATVLQYMTAHIYLLDGVALSQRPLHDLRSAETEDHAEACGISYRNIALIWKCLLSMEKGGLPLGNEPRLADLATMMQRDAKRFHDENRKDSGAVLRKKRRENVRQARYIFGVSKRT